MAGLYRSACSRMERNFKRTGVRWKRSHTFADFGQGAMVGELPKAVGSYHPRRSFIAAQHVPPPRATAARSRSRYCLRCARFARTPITASVMNRPVMAFVTIQGTSGFSPPGITKTAADLAVGGVLTRTILDRAAIEVGGEPGARHSAVARAPPRDFALPGG